MWATAMVTPSGYDSDKYYFLINIFLIALLFIGTAILISKINPSKWYLLPVLPAVIASLYINWDMWAVITAIAAIYWFDRKRYELSAIALAVSIATKFFPVVLLIPIVAIFFHQRQLRSAVKYVLTSGGIWLLINAPFAITTPTGWWRFFKLNGSRPADLGSLWQALNIFGLNPPAINALWIALFLLGAGGTVYLALRRPVPPTLAQSAFIFVALFTALNKVYSPQYVLWLAPLGVLALTNKRDRGAFWLWQGAEAIYHFAIWEYLATYGGSKFSLPAHWYAAAILLRIATSLFFALRSFLSTAQPLPQEEEFLQIGGAS
jgi:uncharacterized membrane protein